MVCRELELPARADARLRCGHDPRVVDEQVDGAVAGEEALGEDADAVEVGEVERLDLHARQAGERGLGAVGSPGRHHHLGPRRGQRTHGLDADAGIAAGDDCVPIFERDALQDLGGGAVAREAGVYPVLWCGHAFTVGLGAGSKSSCGCAQPRRRVAARSTTAKMTAPSASGASAKGTGAKSTAPAATTPTRATSGMASPA